MRVALAQICSGRDVDNNLALVRARVEDAAAEQARLVVFPEATMRAFGHNLDSIAETVDGPFAKTIGGWAREFGVTIVTGMFSPAQEPRPAGARPKVRNTLLVASPAAPLVAYDKIHLFDAFGFAESDTVEAGTDLRQVDVDGTLVGLGICYDLRFPQLFINHARVGATVIIAAASWGDGPTKADQWEVLARARALDSMSWILACGQADPMAAGVPARSGAPTGIGGSMVVSPDGTVVTRAGRGPELLIADIDPAAAEQARATIPVLVNAKLS